MLVDGTPWCAERHRAADPATAVRHEQWCHWWTDGTRYRSQPPPDAWSSKGLRYGETDRDTVEWLVTLTDVVSDPVLVPTRRRCVHPTTRADWPGYDQLFQSSCGWEVAGAGEGNDPMWHRLGFMDHMCAMGSLISTLLALFHRHRL